MKVSGRWTYLYRAIDHHGHVVDVLVSQRRDGAAARALFTRALTHGSSPVEVTTDRAPVYARVIDELASAARHVTERYSNNAVEADHGRLKARLRPMRGLKTITSLRTIASGHAFVQTCAAGATRSPSTWMSSTGCESRSTRSRCVSTAPIAPWSG